MRPLGGAVRRALRAIGLDSEIARADAVRVWPQVATAVVGHDAARTRAVRVEDRTLVIAVPTAQWASELRLRERELLAALAAASPGAGLRRIRAVPDEPARERPHDERAATD